MNKTLYTLEYEAHNGNCFIKAMNAVEVARILECAIIPKKYPFKLREYISGMETPAFMIGDDKSITINRDFGVSPTILKALS
jgi:hypothetical protein